MLLSNVYTVSVTVRTSTDHVNDEATENTVSVQLIVVSTHSETADDQTLVTYEIVATVLQTDSLVGTSMVTTTDSVTYVLRVDDQTYTVSTIVTGEA